ncbi:hypothetical protein HHK36_002242 [Tetracentron sinense]|uniref:Leucine-rich repeat-containing N-terminal plant-type domain-containing protein n=1 Tax=Tetracentron sinense TaxID=13715 RepID=A0A835DVU4_TETSI|nr:hypothetical protein HHK36_002242 [Tetracentron sinense]
MGSSLSYLLFLLSLFHIIITCEPHPCLHHQSSALLHFKRSFSITGSTSCYCAYTYPKVESWNPDTDCCFWEGVTCDIATGHVIGLDLSCTWLYGSIHSNSTLFHLRHLQTLNLACNDFKNSHISYGFHRLTSLTHLNLSTSGFSGRIASQISRLTKLISLDLSSNYQLKPSLGKLLQRLANLRELKLDRVNISSVVPNFLGNFSSLTSLSLFDCNLFGEFPTSIFLLPNLQTLVVGHNPNLAGYFPEFHSDSSLRLLDLSETKFFGKLPNSIGNLKLLNQLALSDCNFSGSIPYSLWNLTQLVILDLSNNKFNGRIPSSLSNLTRIESLSLEYNQLTGPLPSYVSQLSNLTCINLSGNSLGGEIPASLFTLPSLRDLDLSENKLTGSLNEFQSSSVLPLEEINLWGNELHGPIPRSFSKLKNLRSLDLSLNKLSGTVESDMFLMLKNLTRLCLSYNSLSLITTVRLNSTFPKFQWLSFSSNMISEFPDFLRNQNKLEYLDLSNNKIHGQIPKWMWNVGKETLSYMNLSHNFLQGLEEPPTILPWGRLNFLDLHSNQLQGPFPVPPLSTTYFSVSSNNLTGEIPPLICKVSSLYILDLSNNHMSGLIPQCMGGFSNVISVLNLGRNRFRGTIPPTFTNGSNLRTLDFSNNQLRGRVPRSLVNCKKLEVLDLGNNQLNDTFPFWLERLPELQVLTLRSNKLHGTVERHRTDYAFSKLRIIDLSYNEFTGDLPSTYFLSWSAMMMSSEKESQLKYMGGVYYQNSVIVMNKGQEMKFLKILTIFTAIDLSNNKFQGEIPKSIGNLKSLRALNFSHNSLTGHIPSSLGNLTKLESLDLSQNKLSGEIPQQLTNLTFLAVLNLSRNHLMGRIPQGQQFETFSYTSYDGNSGLCGYPLSEKCGNVKDVQPPPSTFQKGQDSEGMRKAIEWKAVLMGYGCGVVIGAVIGYIIIGRQNGWLVKTTEATLSKRNKKRSNKIGDMPRQR